MPEEAQALLERLCWHTVRIEYDPVRLHWTICHPDREERPTLYPVPAEDPDPDVLVEMVVGIHAGVIPAARPRS